ncbi:MAG TPA: alpha/beta fold hydrolase [Ilumatobacteraceae bacterium]|nr:alpha/beta fold hydrolase [Ilumatobacteraceae bacterium]
MANIERIAYPIVFSEVETFKETYGGVAGQVVLEAHLVRPVDSLSDTVLVFMHPIGGGSYLPIVSALARAGHHVIYANSRYRGVDSALIMEKVLVDLGAAIRHAKEKLGYSKVVLAGWSGGGSLSLYYQEQAEHTSVTETPAGDPIDLAAARLIPADGIIVVAAHTSRHRVLTDGLDPSIIDEHDLSRRDARFDLFDPSNPAQPPYSADYLAEFRAAQIERNRRITSWVQDTLAELRATGHPGEERGFVVHGTCADPRWLDITIDPNERPAGHCWLGDPAVANHGPTGLARFCTLRSWLSQWSWDLARGDGLRAAANISIPALVVWHGADDVCVPVHSTGIYDAIRHDDKELVGIPGATHYYIGPGQAEHLQTAVEQCGRWLAAHGFAEGSQ